MEVPFSRPRTLEKRHALVQYMKSYRDTNQQQPGVALVVTALKECSSFKDLESGREIHARFVKAGNYSDIFVQSTLVDMYAKCGSLTDAIKVFESMQQKNVVTWNIIIQGYAQTGQGELALDLFFHMQLEQACPPNHVTYLAALKACISCTEKEQATLMENGKLVKLECLGKGQNVHAHARQSGHDKHSFVASRLVDMYSKCGFMEEARVVFEGMVHKDVVSWNCTIMGYAESGDGDEALKLYTRMQRQEPSVTPNYVTHLAALKACISCAEKENASLADGKLIKVKCLEKGRRVHAQAIQPGVELHLFLESTLVDMYSKCGSMWEARKVFESMATRSIVTWTALIQGYADNGEGRIAFELYRKMQLYEGMKPNDITFIAALKACMALAEDKDQVEESLSKAKHVHSQVAAAGCEIHLLVANALVELYSKCGSMVECGLVFSCMTKPSIVSWTGIISGCAQTCQGDVGLKLFREMQEQGCKPDAVTCVAAVKACGSLQASENNEASAKTRYLVNVRRLNRVIDTDGAKNNRCLVNLRRLHRDIDATDGVEADGHLGSTLVDVYAKCSSLSEARSVFDRMKRKDFVTWNCMISGYAQVNDESHRALELFHMMLRLGVAPDAVTYVGVLKACGGLGMREQGKLKAECLEQCRLAHSLSIRDGIVCHPYVGNMLIDAYSKCGCMDGSWRVFCSLSGNSSVVSWTALIVACVDSKEPKLALDLLSQMKFQAGVEPDAVAYVAALEACGVLGDVETGRRIEAQARDCGYSNQLILINALVNLYGKCGAVDEARRVFSSGSRSLITWNALLDGYSRQGDFQQVIHLFEQMQEEKFEPNDVTFLSVLTACSHSGAVEKGKEYWELMQSPRFCIHPGVKHYTCMVDLLGRSSRLDEALEVVNSMPCEVPKSVLWTTLLGACQKWKNVCIGQVAFESLLRLEGDHSSAYVLMSNIYATGGEQDQRQPAG